MFEDSRKVDDVFFKFSVTARIEERERDKDRWIHRIIVSKTSFSSREVAIFKDSREESDGEFLSFSSRKLRKLRKCLSVDRVETYRWLGRIVVERSRQGSRRRARMLNAADGSIGRKRDVYHAVRRRRRRRRDRSYVRSMPVQWTFSNSISR